MSGGESSLIAAVGGITLPAMRLSGTLAVVTFGMRSSSCVIPALRKLRRLLAGLFAGAKAGDTTDTDILAAKVETTTRMAKWAHLHAQELNGAS